MLAWIVIVRCQKRMGTRLGLCQLSAWCLNKLMCQGLNPTRHAVPSATQCDSGASLHAWVPDSPAQSKRHAARLREVWRILLHCTGGNRWIGHALHSAARHCKCAMLCRVTRSCGFCYHSDAIYWTNIYDGKRLFTEQLIRGLWREPSNMEATQSQRVVCRPGEAQHVGSPPCGCHRRAWRPIDTPCPPSSSWPRHGRCWGCAAGPRGTQPSPWGRLHG